MMVVTASDPRWSARATDHALASVDAGEEFEISTLDCRAETIRGHGDLHRVADASHINPITGPLEIRGAQPGSTLSIAISAIERQGNPLMLVRPGVTTFEFTTHAALEFPQVLDEFVEVCGVRIPMEPMIGFIATTPQTGELLSSRCGVTGGNLDARILTTGTKVLLPVEVPGAGLFVGDVHLAQGDGELFLTGVECSASVRLAAEPKPDVQVPGPVIITDDIISILGDGESLDEAASVASNRAVTLLTDAFELTPYDAGFVLSASSHLRVCRFLPNYGSVCRIEIPRQVIDQLTARTPTGDWLSRWA